MTTSRVTPTIALGLLATAALGAMSTAEGAPPLAALSVSDNVPRAVVSYADLNLAAPSDAKRLLQRIAGAAVEVCGDPTLPGSLGSWARRRHCIETAIARAVDSVASEKLTMAYAESRYAPQHPLLSPRAASIAATPGR